MTQHFSTFDWDASPFLPIAMIGQGGMGQVWRARDRRLGREVAVKLLLHGDGSPAGRDRFRREALVAASLEHPNVLRVHEVLESGRCPGLVYELVEDARTLSQAWGTSLRERVRLLRDASLGVAHAHAAGVVHRDLKPDNLLVDRRGHVRVADFGIAYQATDQRLTASRALIGSPGYMAPEQYAQRGAPGPPVDVWSLGVILYEALCDRPPFLAAGLLETLTRSQAGLAGEERGELRKGPAPLVALVEEALAVDPARRPPDAGVFAERLSAWLEGAAEGQVRGARPALLLVGLAALGATAVVTWEALPAPAPPSPTLTSRPSPPSASATPQPPPELVQALEGPPGPRRSLAALELIRGGWPLGSAADQVEDERRRLGHEPLARLRYTAPSEATKKDWELAFRPGLRLTGLADEFGAVVTWDIASETLVHARRSEVSWELAIVSPYGGIAFPAGGAVFAIDLERGSDRALLAPGQERWAGAAWTGPNALWLVSTRQRLVRLDPVSGAQTAVEVPLPFQAASLCAGREGIVVAAAAESYVHFLAWKPGQAPARLHSLPRDTAREERGRIAYEPASDTLALSSGSELVLLEPGQPPRSFGPPPPDRLLWEFLRWHHSGASLWRWGRDPRDRTRGRLELLAREAGAIRADWHTRGRVGDVCISDDDRFAAISLRDRKSDLVVEVWYVGPEVLERR